MPIRAPDAEKFVWDSFTLVKPPRKLKAKKLKPRPKKKLAYRSKLALLLGDTPGHPFRGNQWSDGGGTATASGNDFTTTAPESHARYIEDMDFDDAGLLWKFTRANSDIARLDRTEARGWPKGAEARAQRQAETIDRIIENAPKLDKPALVWRGVKDPLDGLKPGDTFRIPHHVSTSFDKSVASGFTHNDRAGAPPNARGSLLRIVTSHGLAVEKESKFGRERELILPRNRTYRVEKVVPTKHGDEIWVVDDPTAKAMHELSVREVAILLGGEGSGNFGHAGRVGEVGGSAPGTGKITDHSKKPSVKGKNITHVHDTANDTVVSDVLGMNSEARVRDLAESMVQYADEEKFAVTISTEGGGPSDEELTEGYDEYAEQERQETRAEWMSERQDRQDEIEKLWKEVQDEQAAAEAEQPDPAENPTLPHESFDRDRGELLDPISFRDLTDGLDTSGRFSAAEKETIRERLRDSGGPLSASRRDMADEWDEANSDYEPSQSLGDWIENERGSRGSGGEETVRMEFTGSEGTTMTRVFKRDENGDLVVDHAYFKAFKTGGGIAKDVMRGSFDEYEKLGIAKVIVHANIDVGGYAWAKFGFKLSGDSETPNVSTWLARAERKGKITAEERQILQGIADAHHGDDTLLWNIADAKHPDTANIRKGDPKIGAAVLIDSDWYGELDLHDKEAMGRLRTYIAEVKADRPAPVKDTEAATPAPRAAAGRSESEVRAAAKAAVAQADWIARESERRPDATVAELEKSYARQQIRNVFGKSPADREQEKGRESAEDARAGREQAAHKEAQITAERIRAGRVVGTSQVDQDLAAARRHLDEIQDGFNKWGNQKGRTADEQREALARQERKTSARVRTLEKAQTAQVDAERAEQAAHRKALGLAPLNMADDPPTPPEPPPAPPKPTGGSREMFYEDEHGNRADRDLWRDILGDDFPHGSVDDEPPPAPPEPKKINLDKDALGHGSYPKGEQGPTESKASGAHVTVEHQTATLQPKASASPTTPKTTTAPSKGHSAAAPVATAGRHPDVPVAPGTPGAVMDYGYGNRYGTHTPKGLGYFGPLKRADGGVMTEFSVGVNIGGKEQEVPTFVPTLTPEELAQLLALPDGQPVPDTIIKKAMAHAAARLQQGLDPFAQPGEQATGSYPQLARAEIPKGKLVVPPKTAAQKAAERKLAAKERALAAKKLTYREKLVFLLGGEGSGNFGHAGRVGEVGGSAPGEGDASVDDAHRAATARLRAAVPGVDVHLTPGSLTVARAANTVADVMGEMRAKGYEMPDSIMVVLAYGKSPRAEVASISDGPGKGQQHMTIDIPETLPADANLDDAVMVAFGRDKEFVARSFKDIVVHEMGHVQAGVRGLLTDDPVLPKLLASGFRSRTHIDAVMGQVSDYAAKNQNEFLAEAFLKQYRDGALPREAAKLYRLMNGPQVKP